MPGGGKLAGKIVKRFLPAVVEKRIAKKTAVTVVDDIAANAVKKKAANTAFRESAERIIDIEFEEVVEKNAATLLKESKGKRILKWLGREAVGVGLFIAADAAFEHFFGDEDPEVKKTSTDKELADALDMVLLTNTGHYSLIMSHNRMRGGDRYYSDEARFMESLVEDILFSKASISGADLMDSLISRINSLTDSERVFMIVSLVRVAKEIAIYSHNPSSMRLLGMQAMCSSMVNASPSTALSILMDRSMLKGPSSESFAATQCLSFESLFEALRDKLADKFFNDSTSVFDLFDAFDSDLKPQDEEVLRSLYTSMLVSDDTSASQKGWWDKWKVDKDGEDDESAAVRALTMLSSVDPTYRTLVSAINQDDKNRADMLLTNLK